MPNHERFRLRYDLRMSAEQTHADVLIYGEICEDWWKWTEADISALDFDKLLKDAKAKGVKNLTLRINSPGGDVNQAVAMRTMLMNSGMEEIKISIEGMCASAATLIACLPGAHVTMSEGSEYMIHNPRSGAYGEARTLEANALRLRNTEKETAAIYARKSGQSEEDIRGWMDAETWMTAKVAQERGFVDTVLEEEPIVASVSGRTMAAMRRMYAHIPEGVKEHAEEAPAEGKTDVSTAKPTVAAGDATENKNLHEEEENTMEIKDITLEQLRTENPTLHGQIMQAGAQQERERIQEIDDLTPAGDDYAEMAATAKQNGTTAMDFHKQIVKHQREKGQKFLSQRQTETAPADKIEGGDPKMNDGKTDKQELDSHAKEMATLAKEMRYGGLDGNMY